LALNVVEIELPNFERFQVGLIICLVPHQSSVFAAVYINANLPQPDLSSGEDGWLVVI
jgi:hypothetical protein